MSKHASPKRYLFVSFAIIGVSAAALWWSFDQTLTISTRSPRSDFLLAIGRSALQLGVLGTLAVLAKFTLDEVNRDRQSREDDRHATQEALDRLRKTHQTIRGLPFRIANGDADDQIAMLALIETRIELSDLGNEFRIGDAHTAIEEKVRTHLMVMTDYVAKLLQEYVEASASRSKTADAYRSQSREEFSKYVENGLTFDRRDEKEPSYKRYKDSYDEAKKLLREALKS